MENILVTVSIGSAMVLIIDFIRKAFPQLTVRQVKFITVATAIILSALLLLAQTNQDVAKYITDFLIILGTSQALYALVFKDTDLHKDLTKEGVAQG